MSRRAGKPILPWPVLALGAVAAGLALFVAFVIGGQSDGGGDGGGATLTPLATPTLGPVTGTIGYITPDGNFALMNGDGTDQRRLTDDGVVKSITWSPDGLLAALETGAGSTAQVRVVRADGSAAFEVAGSSNPLWSPDGSYLAVTKGDKIEILDAGGDSLRVFDNATLPAWAPDSGRIAFAKLDADEMGVPVIGSISTGDETPLATDIAPAEPVFTIAWHPAGALIAYWNRLYELATGSTTDLQGTAISWSPDGRILLAAGEFNPGERGTTGLVLDSTQEFKQTIGFIIRQSAQDIPAQLFAQKWIDWTSDGRFLLYMDPEPGREAVRMYDTVAVMQDPNWNIAGERPRISADGKAATFMYQEKVWVLTFMEQDKVGEFPLKVSALAAVADGGFPEWQPVP